MTQQHWDPADNERRYYRHHLTGDLGYLVVRDGKDRIRLDRPAQEIIQPYVTGDWIEENDWKPYSKHQIHKFAFQVDQIFCNMSGLYAEAKREWLSLKDEERIAWMKDGPGPGHLRAELYQAIMGVLNKHAR